MCFSHVCVFVWGGDVCVCGGGIDTALRRAAQGEQHHLLPLTRGQDASLFVCQSIKYRQSNFPQENTRKCPFKGINPKQIE